MTGIIILAAGQSKRLGTPKQTLVYNGKTLLEHAVTTAAASKAEVVIVILGFSAANLQPATNNNKVFYIVNTAWATGMGSSVRAGTQWLMEHEPSITNILVMLCDQPFVTASLLDEMMDKKASSSKGIIACTYAGITGVPVLFGHDYISALAALQGEAGAKKILQQHADDVEAIDFPKGIIDIDTMEDYNKL